MSEENIIKLKKLDNLISKKRNEIVTNYNDYDGLLYADLFNYIDLLVESIVSSNSSFDNIRTNEIIQLIRTAIRKFEKNPPKKVGKYTVADIKKYINMKYPTFFDDDLKNWVDIMYEKVNDDTPINILNELATYSYSYAETIPINVANKIIKTYGSDETADIPTGALKAAIISIGQYELNKNGINDTTIFFGDGYDYQNEKERLGFYSLKSKSIIIDDKEFIEYYRKKRNVDLIKKLLIIIFHEIEHVIQGKLMTDNDEISFKKILFIKEHIIRKESSSFYKNNYMNIFMEIYARIASKITTRDYMTNILNMSFRNSDEFKSIIIDEINRLNDGMFKHVNFIEEDVPLLEFFDYYMCNLSKGEIQKHFDNYPVLKFEYNQDGSKKTPTEVFLQIDNKLQELNFSDIQDKTRKKADLYSYANSFITYSLAHIIMDEDNISTMNLQDQLLKTIISSSIEKLYKKEIDNHDEEVRSTRGK